MRRTLVQLDEETYRKLREWAFRHERSISSVVREMVARGLGAHGPGGRRSRITQFASVRAGRSKQGTRSPVSENHDRALAAAYEK